MADQAVGSEASASCTTLLGDLNMAGSGKWRLTKPDSLLEAVCAFLALTAGGSWRGSQESKPYHEAVL